MTSEDLLFTERLFTVSTSTVDERFFHADRRRMSDEEGPYLELSVNCPQTNDSRLTWKNQ
jgi:hypothetical protein